MQLEPPLWLHVARRTVVSGQLAIESLGLLISAGTLYVVFFTTQGHRRTPLVVALILLLLVMLGGHLVGAAASVVGTSLAATRAFEGYWRLLLPVFWLLLFGAVVHARTGAALAASDRRFRATFEQIPIGIAHISASGGCVRINDHFCALLGLPRDALLGEPFTAIALGDYTPSGSTEQISVKVDPVEDSWQQIRCVRPDGAVRWLDVSLRPVSGAVESDDFLAIVAEDTTEQRRTEAALLRSELRLRDFTEAASDWVWEMGPDLRFTFLSERIESIVGIPAAHFIGRTRVDAGVDDETADWEGHVADMRAGRPFREFRYSVVLEDGVRKWFATSGKPIFDAAGEFQGYRGAARDVTVEVEAAHALQESDLRFKLAVNGTREGLWDWDLVTDRVWFSPVWWEIIGLDNDPVAQECYKLRDCLHPDDLRRVRREMARHLRGRTEFFHSTYRHWHVDGRWLWVEARGRCTGSAPGQPERFSGRLTDVTEQHELANQLAFYATHDSLTGLLNRREFERRLEEAVAEAKTARSHHALCYMDLDQFKVLNDTCGHGAGDEMLRQLGDWLSDTVRSEDLLARLGGDEFGVLLFDCSLDKANRISRTLLDAVTRFRFTWDEQTYTFGASVGVVAITPDSPDATAALSAADSACYAAKDEGRNRIHLYYEDDIELVRRHGEMRWAARVQQALDEDRLKLHYQLISPADPGNDCKPHYEILVRLQDEDGELIMPNAFLPPAERYGLITRIDSWVVKATFDWLADHPDHIGDLGICAINLSGASLGSEDVLRSIDDGLRRVAVPPGKLCFEVTETAAVHNLPRARRFMATLQEWGCLFALDDFGTGVCSFSYLKNLPVDFLKIDGEFVRGMLTDPTQSALVRSINDIGHVMGKRTIAEFVETDDLRQRLAEIGVDYVQGHVLGKPQPLDSLISGSAQAVSRNGKH